jgi:hypothetical protein
VKRAVDIEMGEKGEEQYRKLNSWTDMDKTKLQK